MQLSAYTHKKQIRPNKHRWGTIHKSCGQILDKLQDPIPGRPDEYYLPHCIADVSNGMKPGTVPRNITTQIVEKCVDPRIFVALTFEAEVYEKFLAPAMEFTRTFLPSFLPSSLP